MVQSISSARTIIVAIASKHHNRVLAPNQKSQKTMKESMIC
jgi:hypothetical protein